MSNCLQKFKNSKISACRRKPAKPAKKNGGGAAPAKPARHAGLPAAGPGPRYSKQQCVYDVPVPYTGTVQYF